MRRCLGILLLTGFLGLLASGCILTATVPLDKYTTPNLSGGVKLIAGPNVPFEYEEIAYHYQHYRSSQAKTVNDAISRFCQEARAMSGDAVVNFRTRTCEGGNHYILEGVVVKIKRP